jgi:hypothetical protein
MSDSEFVDAVQTMREHQRNFFKAEYGSPEKHEALKNSKTWERIVDRELERRTASETAPSLDL